MQISPTTELLLCCTHINVYSETADRIRQLTQENIDWVYLIDQARKHGTIPLLYWNINEICRSNIPKLYLSQLSRDFYNNTSANLFISNHLLGLLNSFQESSIDTIPFKGVCLAASVYRNLALRKSSYPDILIRKSDIHRAKDVLISQGYQIERTYQRKLALRNESKKIYIELYWNIIPDFYPANLIFEDLVQTLEFTLIANHKISTISSEYLLLILCLSLIQNFQDNQEQLFRLCDISNLIFSYPNLNWERIYEHAIQMGYEYILYFSLGLVKAILNTDIPKHISLMIQENPQIKFYIQLAQYRILQIHTSKNTNNFDLRKLINRSPCDSSLLISQDEEYLPDSPKIIHRYHQISREDFISNYYSKQIPVLISDAFKNVPAASLWSPGYFQKYYGHSEVEIMAGRQSDPNYEINMKNHKKSIRLREYIDNILISGETNDYYMVANNSNLERSDLAGLLGDLSNLPNFLNQNFTSNSVFLWLGPTGTVTPLHYDQVNIIMLQIYGRKLWRIISPEFTKYLYNHTGVYSEIDCDNPNYSKHPLYKNVQIIETIVEPGEMIFIPSGWWHQVRALDVSISTSFTSFSISRN